jgi:antitoxin component of MazEF toxin-antitoxin module
MQVVKVRRVGNSNVISLPRDLGVAGFEVGASVLIEATPNGDLRISPLESRRSLIRAIGQEVAARHRGALEMLAAYDRGEVEQRTGSRVAAGSSK